MTLVEVGRRPWADSFALTGGHWLLPVSLNVMRDALPQNGRGSILMSIESEPSPLAGHEPAVLFRSLGSRGIGEWRCLLPSFVKRSRSLSRSSCRYRASLESGGYRDRGGPIEGRHGQRTEWYTLYGRNELTAPVASAGRSAFTLIEMLVATSVFVLLLALTLSVVTQTSQVWRRATVR